MRAWLIIGLFGIVAAQPFQERQSTHAPQEHGEITAHPTQPTTAPSTCCLPASTKDQAAAAQKPSYWQKAFDGSVLSNWALVLVGIGATIAALCTLGYVRRQADIMHGQLSIPHRAYLTIGEPLKMFEDQAWIPIENYGRVDGHLILISVEIIVQRAIDGAELYRRDIRQEMKATISPGKANAFILYVVVPDEARNEQVVIACSVNYDTGFNSIDTLEFVRVYSFDRARWTTASEGITINFKEQKGGHT